MHRKGSLKLTQQAPHVAIIGAGIGGLAAALRLAHGGARVTVLERHSAPGGKMRTLPTVAGPVDAGPTVLTLKPVFDALFSDVGLRLEDHVTLESEAVLARHFWADGTVLDLMRDVNESRANVAATFGKQAAAEFSAFSERTARLYDTFEGSMIRGAAPSQLGLTLDVLRNPRLIRAMEPHRSLSQSLFRHFTDPRLAQLYARYATYVGGVPAASPALLGLISQAEARGVWHVEGGMHRLALAIAKSARSFGATFQFDTHVSRIETKDGHADTVVTQDKRIPVDAVLFNGDPMALSEGALGQAMTEAIPLKAVAPRSLSARVMSFAAVPKGALLAAHNVFFADDPYTEYAPLAEGREQSDPTLYICAQDRFGGAAPQGPERFEIILNSPALPDSSTGTDQKERAQCQSLILKRLARFGLSFSASPGPDTLSMPADFDALFPHSKGALYGRSPHGMLAAFKRPQARSKMPGLYLTGGGVHPGAGVPMATLSAHHAAAAILSDLSLTLPSRRADTRGGMSTASVTMAPARSR